jgi:hypothetical protein
MSVVRTQCPWLCPRCTTVRVVRWKSVTTTAAIASALKKRRRVLWGCGPTRSGICGSLNGWYEYAPNCDIGGGGGEAVLRSIGGQGTVLLQSPSRSVYFIGRTAAGRSRSACCARSWVGDIPQQPKREEAEVGKVCT